MENESVETIDLAKAQEATQALLNPIEVADLLNVPVSWVYERSRKRSVDRIPGFRLGKYWRFHKADVLSWLERQQRGGR